MTRKICVITGTRADYGLLRWLMQDMLDDPTITLQVLATGMHLSPEFGLTYKQIEQDGFAIDRKVEMLMSSDTATGVTKSIGVGLLSFADAFHELKPDILVLLGDRFEALAAATAALVARIPVAHLHGGEASQGAMDEAIRHAITKMSHFHFVSAEPYRKRVVQLGEDPKTVHLVGGFGVDAINRQPILQPDELAEELQFPLRDHNLLVAFHPATLDVGTAEEQMSELLAALDELRADAGLIFTLPNADPQGRSIASMIDAFVSTHANACAFHSLGQERFFSFMALVDGIVGNSSSGLLEAPSFGIGTVNVGNRQEGRLMASSVISCQPDRADISYAIEKMLSDEFRTQAAKTVNPYGSAGASKRTLDVLRDVPLAGVVKKRFFDLPIIGTTGE